MTKLKSPLGELFDLVHGHKSVYILIYGNVDPDAVSSAWALKELLRTQGLHADIGYTGEVGRLENEVMISSLRVPVGPVNRHLLETAELVAIVDAQPEFFKDYPLPRADIVIDHHPRKSDKQYPFTDIRPRCLSTATILTDYLMSCPDYKMPKRLATALFYGLQTDSKGLRRSGTPLDVDVLNYLDKLTDHALLRRIELSQYSLGSLDYFSIALTKRRYARNIIYAHLGSVQYADICSQVAEFLIRVREAHWSIVSGVIDHRLVIVFRGDGRLKNAGKLASAAFGELGSAGGHKTMGRAEIDATALGKMHLTDNESVESFVVGLLARVDRSFLPLMRVLPGEVE